MGFGPLTPSFKGTIGPNMGGPKGVTPGEGAEIPLDETPGGGVFFLHFKGEELW